MRSFSTAEIALLAVAVSAARRALAVALGAGFAAAAWQALRWRVLRPWERQQLLSGLLRRPCGCSWPGRQAGLLLSALLRCGWWFLPGSWFRPWRQSWPLPWWRSCVQPSERRPWVLLLWRCVQPVRPSRLLPCGSCGWWRAQPERLHFPLRSLLHGARVFGSGCRRGFGGCGFCRAALAGFTHC